MMNIIQDEDFQNLSNEQNSFVFQIFPDVHKDNRGWFTEVLNNDFLKSIQIKQINRSCSRPGVIRGCHAQLGKFCQAKLVEAINVQIFDVITDCRPQSSTFSKTKVYLLDPDKQNKLFVPKGFLHAFIVPDTLQQMAYFNYYCDNVYSKESEVCVNPKDIILPSVNELKTAVKNDALMSAVFNKLVLTNSFIFSDKDCNGKSFKTFCDEIMQMYNDKIIWYK